MAAVQRQGVHVLGQLLESCGQITGFFEGKRLLYSFKIHPKVTQIGIVRGIFHTDIAERRGDVFRQGTDLKIQAVKTEVIDGLGQVRSMDQIGVGLCRIAYVNEGTPLLAAAAHLNTAVPFGRGDHLIDGEIKTHPRRNAEECACADQYWLKVGGREAK